eukprot:245780-Rhodomonas_salina.1
MKKGLRAALCSCRHGFHSLVFRQTLQRMEGRVISQTWLGLTRGGLAGPTEEMIKSIMGIKEEKVLTVQDLIQASMKK